MVQSMWNFQKNDVYGEACISKKKKEKKKRNADKWA